MIDFHTHILPGIDDGSKSCEESLEMLGFYGGETNGICLTPHFYPSCDNPDAFFERREKAYAELSGFVAGKVDIPLYKGAEVAFYEGIHNSSDIEKFKLGNTRLLLVEMPMHSWNMRMIDEVLELNRDLGLRPVMAHIDRYDFLSGHNRKFLECFLSNRGLVQVNASAFMSLWTRKKAINMIREGAIHFIGSDTHNTTFRKPVFHEVIAKLENSSASDVIDIVNENEERYFVQ